MSYFTNYTLSVDCLLQFFYLVRRHPSLPGSGLPDEKEFSPQLRAHSFRTDYDSLISVPPGGGTGFFVASISENQGRTSEDDPRFDAVVELQRTDDQLVQAVTYLNIGGKSATPRTFLIPPDTIVPFMVNLYGPREDEALANTALVLHGVFKGGHRVTPLDLLRHTVIDLGRFRRP